MFFQGPSHIWRQRLRIIPLLIFCLIWTIGAAKKQHKHRRHTKTRYNRYDIAYIWANDYQNALNYKTDVAKALGREVQNKLIIVQNQGRYGVVYDRNGDLKSSQQIVFRHSKLLKKAKFKTKPGPVIVQNNLFKVAPSQTARSATLKRAPVLKKITVPAPKVIPPDPIFIQPETETLAKTGEDAPDAEDAEEIDTPDPLEIGPVIPLDQPGDSRHNSPSQLKKDLANYILNLKQKRILAKTDEIGLSVYDLSRDRQIMELRGDKGLMSASTIKIFVMLAFFDRFEQGEIKYTPKIKTQIRRMIQRSSNSATNYMINYVGGVQKIQEILTNHYPIFKHTSLVEKIPSGGRTYLNTTSTDDLNAFFRELWNNTLPYSEEMKNYLGLPSHNRLLAGTCLPQNIEIFNKTGTVYGMVGDAGMLVMTTADGQTKAYAIACLIQDRTKVRDENRRESYRHWARTRAGVIRRLSEGVYGYFHEHYNQAPYVCPYHQGRHLSLN
jgi:beta-lactamase class A